MTARRPSLPPAWYQTLDETAAELGTHPERLLYYADAGLVLPAALVAKSALPMPVPGPAPYIVVRLDDYRQMAWLPEGDDMVAPLIGIHRGYQVDGHTYANVDFDGTGVLVRRSQLVLTCDQVEALQEACGHSKPPHAAKTRMQQRIMAVLITDRWPQAGDYTIAEAIVRAFQLHGMSISKECASRHVKDCLAEFAAAKLPTRLNRAA